MLEDIFDKITDELSSCEAYNPDYDLKIIKRGCVISVDYHAGEKDEDEVTSLELEIDHTNCHIYWFCIDERKRGNGRGAELYFALERALKEIGCATITLNPTGNGHHFWPKMGFAGKRTMTKYLSIEKETVVLE